MALAVALSGCGGAVADPESARCNSPPARFYAKKVESDHIAVLVRYTCAGARIAGSLYAPRSSGRHPALVWVHGSGPHERLSYGDFVQTLVEAGFAVATFDKRGVGDSEGKCCPGDDGHYNLLAADAAGAVEALRNHAAIDPANVGLFGASEAGWVIPLAVARNRHVAFAAFGSGPAVSVDEERRWSKAAHEDEPAPLPAQEKQKLYADLEHGGGFDPMPYIRRMRIPALWMFGGGDRSIPADRSAALIRALHRKNFTVVIFPNAGHGLFDTPPTSERATPTLVQWVKRQVH